MTMESHSKLYEQGQSHATINCFTLVDITYTNTMGNYKSGMNKLDAAQQEITDFASWTRSRNQQRNLETILQVIGLRAQTLELQRPKMSLETLSNHAFGTEFTGKQRVWSFSFNIEYPLVFDIDGHELLALKRDMSQIPCITGLAETAKIAPGLFSCEGAMLNTYFIKTTNK